VPEDDPLETGDSTTYGDVENINQQFNEAAIRELYDTWMTKWEGGEQFGIVGGAGLKQSITPDTVRGQAEMHGHAEVSRSGTTVFEGLGFMLAAIAEVLDNDVITEAHYKDLLEQIKDMKSLLSDDDKNPRNIPFHTIVDFKEGDDEKNPTITRGKTRGHYRTAAYNKYVDWALEHKEGFKGKTAESEESWYTVGMKGQEAAKNSAKPPLWLAIVDKSEGIMGIAKRTAKLLSPGKVKLDPGKILTQRVRRNAGQLHQIPSIVQGVKEVLSDPSIYPKGKSRAPVKSRLNTAMSDKVFAVAGDTDIEVLKLIIGFSNILGHETTKQFRLTFPANNIALNKLIENVMGEEMDTFQKPGTTDREQKPGLVLKEKVIPLDTNRIIHNWRTIIKREI